MTEPAAQQIFGANVTQDINILTLEKADFAELGLVPAATNTAESLFVSIVLKSSETLTDANRLLNPDQNIVIGEKTEVITTIFENNASKRYKVITIPIELYLEQAEITINPMSY
jgi:hypothetical protein